jgi:membrane dipeptidase
LNREFGIAAQGGGAGAPAAGGAPPCALDGPPSAAGGRGAGANAAVDALPPDRRARYGQRLAEIDATWPAAPRATVRDFVDHIDYLVKRVGIAHVGISSDFDGGGGIEGWNSAAETFNVTLELVRRGYNEEQIGQIWSGNLLRVWADVESVAAGIQAGAIR